MRKKYTYQDMEHFFLTFKNLPNSVDLEDVHQLLSIAIIKNKRNNISIKFKILISLILLSTSFLIYSVLDKVSDKNNEVMKDETSFTLEDFNQLVVNSPTLGSEINMFAKQTQPATSELDPGSFTQKKYNGIITNENTFDKPDQTGHTIMKTRKNEPKPKNNNPPYGDWFLIDLNSSEDTLVFSKDMTTGPYIKWEYNKNNLCISKGRIFDNKNNKVITLDSKKDCYDLSYTTSNNQVDKFKIIKNGSIQKEYKIISLEKNKLKIAQSNQVVEQQTKKSKEKIVYFFINPKVNSTIFQNDSLLLSKRQNNTEQSKIVLKSDLSFNFYYNVSFDTVRNKDSKTGSITTFIIDKSKNIKGRWETIDINKNISLIFENGNVIDYSILDKNNKIYFINTNRK